MKYIKTNDGIFGRMFPNYEKHQMSFDHKTIEPAYYTTKNEWVAKKDVVKQADTIEELCDELVCIRPAFKTPILETLFDDLTALMKKEKDILLESIKRGDIYYGAIWTDKGLIYVAKMNEKGELELL